MMRRLIGQQDGILSFSCGNRKASMWHGSDTEESLRRFRNVTAGAPSIVAGSPITSRPSLADQLLLFVRACVCSGSSLFRSSSTSARSLLIVTHRGVSTGCRESSSSKHISSFFRLQPDLNHAADSLGQVGDLAYA